MHSGCPLNRREVGRAAWAFLHTVAAYYPQQPTREEQQNMEQFMLSMARVYPCGYCADTTRDEMIRNPPRVGSQGELAEWLCEIHNEVNDRLGKPLFDCSKVNERWRTGPRDGSCE
jgi:FAD-linked sulfhydryl oxidase